MNDPDGVETSQASDSAFGNSSAVSRNSARAGPLALGRAIRVLELLSDEKLGLNLAELCRLLQSPKTSVLALVREMVSLRYLIRNSNNYALGPAAFMLGAGISKNGDPDSIISSIVLDLADKSGLTTVFSIFLPSEGVFLHRQVIQSQLPLRYVTSVGTRRTLHDTNSGRAILAFTEPAWRSKYLKRVYEKGAMKSTRIPRTKLERILADVRRDGYACSYGLYVEGVGVVSAPILDSSNMASAVIYVAGAEAHVRTHQKSLVRMVMRAATDISKAIGSNRVAIV